MESNKTQGRETFTRSLSKRKTLLGRKGLTLGVYEKRDAYVWSSAIFILNIYTLFSTIFWASLAKLPQDNTFVLDFLVELIIFLEIMFRTLLSILAPNFLDKLGLLHGLKTDGPIMYLLNVIGSFPYITLARLLISVNAMGEGKTSMSYIILLKLLKSFEIKRYINQIEEKMFYKTAKSIIILRFVLNFGLVLFISHCAASAWLLVQELSSVGWSDNKYTFNNPLNPFSSSN